MNDGSPDTNSEAVAQAEGEKEKEAPANGAPVSGDALPGPAAEAEGEGEQEAGTVGAHAALAAVATAAKEAGRQEARVDAARAAGRSEGIAMAQATNPRHPGLAAYQELLSLEGQREALQKEVDEADAALADWTARRAATIQKLTDIPARAQTLRERIRARLDAIVQSFGS